MTENSNATTSRRRFLTGVGAAAFVAGGTSSRVRSATAPIVTATRIAGGFTAPLAVLAPDDTADRYLVADQIGVVHRIDDGSLADAPFLDIQDRVVDVRGGYSEMGLLGIAVHPTYAENRKVYVRYSAPRRTGTPSSYSHTFVLSEFTAGPNGERVDPASERTLLEIPQPQPNHNAGGIAFGPDGYLHVGVGDGGGANDVGMGHVEDWYSGTPGGNGQDLTTNLLGSLLRIDVDTQDGDRPYGIPPDNPLVDAEGFDEQYAWGLRNPWRFSFDGDDLYVADVGQNLREEINRVVRGGNYGWNVREGTLCFDAENPSSPPTECPTSGPGRPDGTEPLRDPLIEYSHAADETPQGVAVVGGYRYRGTALDGFDGAYLFTDWSARGRLFVARPSEDSDLWPIDVVQMRGEDGDLGQYVLGFGRDRDDELLVCSTAEGTVSGDSGALYKLSGVDQTTVSPTTTETTTPTTTSGDAGPGFGTIATLLGAGGLTLWASKRATDRTN